MEDTTLRLIIVKNKEGVWDGELVSMTDEEYQNWLFALNI